MTEPSPVLDYAPATPARLRGLAGKIARRGGWAITDQAVASIGNFARDALLAAYLTRESYGAYGMMMEVFLFLSSIQAALVVYPVQVKGAVEDEQRLPRFATAATLITLVLALPLMIAMGASTFFAVQGTPLGVTTTASAAMALLVVFQFQELARRTLMSRLRFGAAVPGDAVVYLGQIGALVLLGQIGWLKGPTGVAVGLGAISVLTVIAALMQAGRVGFARVDRADFAATGREFWRLGKWVAAANLTTIFTGLGYNWLLGKLHAPAIAGDYRVVTYLNKLANPIVMTLSGIIVPVVAKTRMGSDVRFAKRVGLKYALIGFGAIGPYMLLLMIVPQLLLWAFFRDYMHVADGVRVFAVTGFVGYWAVVLGSVLNGLGRPQVQFWTQLANTIATISIGLPLTITYGLWGALWGGLISTVILTLVAVFMFWRTK